MTTPEEKYQETVDGIALARRTVAQTSKVIRDAMDNGDDPVVFLHNLAGSLGKESPFQTGGQGSAIYVVACFLLAESGFFEDPDLREKCICPGPENGEPSEYLATCPIHRGSWAETLAIMADRQVMADLAGAEGDVAIAEEMLPAGAEVLAAVEGVPERRYGLRVGQCADPDCLQAGCDGDHDPLRCPVTGVVRGNIATVNGKWICCDGDYPMHVKLKTCGDPYCGKPGCDGTVLHEPDRYVDGGA